MCQFTNGKQHNSSAPPTKICFLRLCLMALCSTIITTLLQVFLVTFAASCCTVSMTLFRILHVTFTASCTTFLWAFRIAVTASCCTVSMALFRTFLIIRLLFVSYLLIIHRVVQLLEYCMRSLSSYVHMFTLVKIT